MFCCYILKSLKTAVYYVGISGDIEERLQAHNTGKVKFTKKYRPWELVYCELFLNPKDARTRELQIKRWKSRKAIERLIKTFKI